METEEMFRKIMDGQEDIQGKVSNIDTRMTSFEATLKGTPGTEDHGLIGIIYATRLLAEKVDKRLLILIAFLVGSGVIVTGSYGILQLLGP
ncbi:MAG: hypothetical protein U1D67_01325 [Dehalococcoidia bacterium]|nr:hypothetical protein [Dehalococcoidia bacterium]